MKILHLDIETAPAKVYAWGLFGQNIAINQIVEPGYTLCWAAKWDKEKNVMFNSIHKSSEKEMLEEIHSLLNEADVVTHWNGKKFDIPTLNKEFLLQSMDVPDPYHQVDLLHVARKQFRFQSNKLDYVSQALGVGSKIEHKGMSLWKDCMNSDQKAWKQMEKYNKMDVVLLEKIYKRMLPWIKNHPNWALYLDEDRPVCTNCGSHEIIKKGTETTLTQMYDRYQCKKCGTPLRGRTTILDKTKRDNILTQSKI